MELLCLRGGFYKKIHENISFVVRKLKGISNMDGSDGDKLLLCDKHLLMFNFAVHPAERQPSWWLANALRRQAQSATVLSFTVTFQTTATTLFSPLDLTAAGSAPRPTCKY